MRLAWKWRIVAAVALGAVLLAAVCLAVIVWRNHGLGLLLAFCLVLAACGGWLLVTGRGVRKWTGASVLAFDLVLFVASLVAYSGDGRSFWLLVFMAGLLLLYISLVARLRVVYWHARQQAEVSGRSKFVSPWLIINPKSGDGRAIKTHIDTLAQQQGIRVFITQNGDDIETIARQAARSGADVLGVSGGDGSIGAVAKVALEAGLPMVVLPGGTRCHFARDIGLDPEYITDALAGFRGVERRVDVAYINGRLFLNNASFGLYADIVSRPAYRANKRRVTQSVLQDVVSGATPPYDLQFRSPDTEHTTAVQVLVGVNRYETYSLFQLGQRRRLDEGVLQITVLSTLDSRTMRKLAGLMSWQQIHKHIGVSQLQQWTTDMFTITNGPSTIDVGVDGEHEQYATPVIITIKPRALRIFVPPGGADRSRPHHALSVYMLRSLLRGLLTGRPA